MVNGRRDNISEIESVHGDRVRVQQEWPDAIRLDWLSDSTIALSRVCYATLCELLKILVIKSP